MINKLKHLQLQILDHHLADIAICESPTGGWIKAIRKSLHISARQLAKRLGISQQSVAKLEANEAHDTITLKSLRKTAQALNCKLVYALIPNAGSLESTLKEQAEKKATEIVQAIDHSMQLEGQGVGNIEEKIAEVTDMLMKQPSSKLWD